FLGALAAYDRYVESRSIGALALALGLLTAAMQLRADASWLIVPATVAALAAPLPPRASIFRTSVAVCALVFIAINAIPTVVGVVGHAEGGYWRTFVLIGSAFGSPWVVPEMTPPTLTALVVLGVLAALSMPRAGWLWLAATLIADPISFRAD